MFTTLLVVTEIWRIAADIRFPTLILKIDLRLIDWSVKQIIGVVCYARPGWRADAQPIQPQRIAAGDPVHRIQWQKILQRLLLATVQHVALIFSDDQRQARDLGRKISQLDAAKIGQRDVAAPVGLTPALVNLSLNRPHLLIGDDQKVA